MDEEKRDEELEFELNLGLEQITGFKFTQLVHKFKATSFTEGIDKLAEMLELIKVKFPNIPSEAHTTTQKQDYTIKSTTDYYCPFCIVVMEFKQKVNANRKTVSWYSCADDSCPARQLSKYSNYGVSFFPSILEKHFKEYLVIPNTLPNVVRLPFEEIIKYSNGNQR